MRRDREIRYVVNYIIPNGYMTPGEWKVRAQYGIPGYGKPTEENLKKYVATLEASAQPGGCNAQLGNLQVLRAEIVDQRTGETLACYYK